MLKIVLRQVFKTSHVTREKLKKTHHYLRSKLWEKTIGFKGYFCMACIQYFCGVNFFNIVSDLGEMYL